MTASTDRTVQPTRRSLPAFLVYVTAVVLVAGIGGLATQDSVQGWYAEADKPAFTPPDWLFGPVWTVLYAGMAIAAWRLSRVRDRRPDQAAAASTALRLWWVQLALNFLWSPLFFAAQWLWVALVDIVALDLVLALLVARAWRLDRAAGLLLAPYLAWVLFATALNTGVALLN